MSSTLSQEIPSDIPSEEQIVARLKLQISKMDSDLAHYQQKHQVQSKRLKYLKKENQQLKVKKNSTVQNSNEIKQQNTLLKQQNKTLKVLLQLRIKEQLKSIQNQLAQYDSNHVPREVTIKQTLITSQTQEVDLSKANITDIDIDSIKSFSNIKTLIMGENQITDQGIKIITSYMTQIKKLFLNHNLITDLGMTEIANLKGLKCLDIRCNRITDLSLEGIGKILTLSQLSLSNNNLTDAGVKQLMGLKELRYLDITSNKITKEGGLLLLGLGQLTNLYLSHNKVNGECVERFISEMKELRVLDVRFNEIKPEEKEKIKADKQGKKELNALQLFL